VLRGRRSGLEPRGALPAAARVHLLRLRGRKGRNGEPGRAESRFQLLKEGRARARAPLFALFALRFALFEASGEQQYLPARDLQQIRQAVEAGSGGRAGKGSSPGAMCGQNASIVC